MTSVPTPPRPTRGAVAEDLLGEEPKSWSRGCDREAAGG
jgi:hypothetical protein